MAVMTEFINLIVPISIIEQKYPGGWARCLLDHKPAIGGRLWYDEYLLRDGAMSPAAMEVLVNEWWKLGFECFVELDGVRRWKDVCVYEGMFGGSSMVCDWLVEDPSTQSVYMKGTEPGELKGRDWDLIDDWEPPMIP